MKTLYLKCLDKNVLIDQIAEILPGYQGEIEFTDGTVHAHFIGKIPAFIHPETGIVESFIEGFHANMLVPDGFDESIINCQIIPPPKSPVHKFA